MGGSAEMICTCHTIGEKDKLRFAECHHRFWMNDRELPSVTKILRSCWPVKPDFAAADPAVLENARQRGSDLDALLSAYVSGSLTCIPAGTREDVKDLFLKTQPWFDDAMSKFGLRSQVAVTDGEIAGILDFCADGPVVILDLKGVHTLEAYYEIQVGGYIDLYEKQYRRQVEVAGILHITARFSKPRWIPLDVDECRRDWRIVRQTWEMAQRRLTRPTTGGEK